MYTKKCFTKTRWNYFISLYCSINRLARYFIAVFVIAVLIVRTGFFVSSTYATAGINQTINFQGKLVDNNGLNVANGNYDITFYLYAASSGGSPLWTETWDSGTTQVAIQDGVFRVALGSHTVFTSFDFNTDSLYLAVKVGADPEMSPRIRFTSVPYAFVAKTVVDDALDFAQLQDTLDLDANLTVNQTGYTWSQTYTGTSAPGLSYTASGAVSSGNAAALDVNVSNASTTVPAMMLTNAGSGFALRINDDGTTTDSTPLVVDAGGNVGIGTTAPSTLLQVAGHISPSVDDTYDLGTSALRFKDLYLGGETLHIGTSTTDEGTLSYNTTSNVLGLSTDSTTNGDIAFFTNNLFLDKSTANVGIGTTAPGYKLQVNESSSTWTGIDSSGNITGGYTTDSRYGLYQNGTVNLSLPAGYDSGALLLSISTGDTIISGGGSGVAGLNFWVGNVTQPKMMIDNTGKVGVGTTAPSKLLEVSGDIKLTNGANQLILASNASNPTGAAGGMYYDSGNNKFKCYTTSWVDCDTTGSGTLPSGTEGQTLYNNAGTWTAHSGVLWDDTNLNLTVNTTGGLGAYIGNAQMVTTNEVGLYESSGDVPLALWDADRNLSRYGDSGALSIDSSGNVGIGTTAPSQNLDVTGNLYVSGNITCGGKCGDIKLTVFNSGTGGNYVVASDDVMVIVEAIGQGGGGGGGSGGTLAGNPRSGGGGGGGGAYVTKTFNATSGGEISGTIAVGIGTGDNKGTGSTGTASSGTAGTNSTFGSYLTAYGGGGGGTTASSGGGGGGGGGTTSAGNSSTSGTGGTGGGPGGGGVGAVPTSIYGGGGGATAAATGPAGGASILGFGGAGGGASSSTGANVSGVGGASGRGGAGGGAGGTTPITTCTLRAGRDGGTSIQGSAGTGGANAGNSGTNGGAATNGVFGGGGGGGGANKCDAAGTGGTGGDGGAPGGGGGGGGGSAFGSGTPTGGNGGKGGRGEVRVWSVQGNNADYAEAYSTNDPTIQAGDVVSLDPSIHLGVKKSMPGDFSNVVGIISTRPEQLIGGDAAYSGHAVVPVALAGRVPVRVSTENGPIQAGDFLTVSSIPGVAMKATKAGVTIGSAIQGYDGNQGEVGTITAYVNTSYTTGLLVHQYLVQHGINVPDDIRHSNNLDYSWIILADQVSRNDTLAASKTLSEINTDRIAAGLEIVTPRVVTQTLSTDTLQSALKKDITINLSDTGQLLIQNLDVNGGPAITFDAFGNAHFAGEISAKSIKIDTIPGLELINTRIDQITSQQSISTIHDEKIATVSSKLETLNTKISAWDNIFISIQSIVQTIQETFVAIQNQLGLVRSDITATKEQVASLSASLASITNWKEAISSGGATLGQSSGSAVLGATGSALLGEAATASGSMVNNSLQVDGKTTFFDLTVLNKLTTGVIELGAGIDGDEINSSTGIRFQTLAQGPIDFMNGKVIIDVDGSISAKHFKLDTLDATSSTGGKAIMPAGELLTTVQTTSVNADSMVFITIQGDYAPATRYWVTNQVEGDSFMVQFDRPTTRPVEFSWIIIN